MDKFEKYLLNLAYDNYLKTNDLKFKFLPKNSEELVQTRNALNSLKNNEYINVLSDNLNNNIFNILSNNDMVFIYSLTNKAISLIKD